MSVTLPLKMRDLYCSSVLLLVILAWLLYRSVFIWTTLSLLCAFFFFIFYFLFQCFIIIIISRFCCTVCLCCNCIKDWSVAWKAFVPEPLPLRNKVSQPLSADVPKIPTANVFNNRFLSMAESIIEPQTTAYMSVRISTWFLQTKN